MEITSGGPESYLVNKQTEESLVVTLERTKNKSLKEYHHLLKFKYYLSEYHLVYLNRFTNVRVYDEDAVTYFPEGKITPHGFAFLWLPHIDKESFDEFKSRAVVYRTMKIIAELDSHKPEGWIIDLRNNTGGIVEYFTAAICQIIDEFELLGYDRKGQLNSVIKSDGDKFELIMDNEVVVAVDYPFRVKIDFKNLYVLINRNTASAAELLTILLRKYKGAKVCGERSYGIVSLMQSTSYRDCTFIYPISKIMFDDGADYIKPDIEGIPEYLNPN